MTARLSKVEKVLAYNDFSGGEFGALGPNHTPANSFTSKNMVLYRSGRLGPRGGLKRWAATGVTTGAVVGFWWRGTPGKALVWVIGTAIQSTDDITPGAATTWTGALASTPTVSAPAMFADTGSDFTHMVVPGDKGYLLTFSTTTVSAVAAIPGGAVIAAFGDRLWVGNKSGNVNRIYYSNAADYTTWPSTNFFDVSNSARGAIEGLYPQRDHLSIFMQNGEWWILSSATVASASLRRLSGNGVQPWVANPRAAVLLGNDDIAYVPPNIDVPYHFSGSTISPLAYMKVSDAISFNNFLNINGGTPYADITKINMLRGAIADDWFGYFPNVAGSVKACTYHNGIHTLHTFENVALSQFGASDTQGHFYISDGGAVGVAQNIYVYDMNLDRPAFTSDARAQPGDNSTTPFDAYVYFPEHWQPAGRTCQVRQVVVDFVKYNTGSPSTNHFDVSVDVIGKYNVDDVTTTAVQSFDEAGASATTAGVRARQVFNFGTDAGIGSGFQIKLKAIRGVAIQSVKVVYDDEEMIPTR